MASVTLQGLSKAFGKVQAVRDITLDIADGEFVVFVGPSGCGKSTLLRMIAGLEEITSGHLAIGGRAMNDVAAAERGIAMVFQSYALYPHMNVRENIGFGIRMAGMPAADVAERVAQAAATLGIESLLDRRPRELSGGQRQRVAIGRCIVKEPGVFLFDEPLSNLDADLRARMRAEIGRLHKALGSTVVYVTHDQVEAMTLASRIVVMRGGTIEQQGSPAELYDRPANIFVATFLGQPRMNLFPAVTVGATDAAPRLRLASGAEVPSAPVRVQPGAGVVVGVRPGDVGLRPVGTEGTVAARVELVEDLGHEALLHAAIDGAADPVLIVRPRGPSPSIGEAMGLDLPVDRMHLFAEDGRRLEA